MQKLERDQKSTRSQCNTTFRMLYREQLFLPPIKVLSVYLDFSVCARLCALMRQLSVGPTPAGMDRARFGRR